VNAKRSSVRKAGRGTGGEINVIGVDFTSAPSRRKPITVAIGKLSREASGGRYTLHEVLALSSFEAFEHFLTESGGWLGGFDLPFGQPRQLIEHEGWPTDWPAFVRFFCGEKRERLRETFRRYCAARPVGDKFAWRKADKPAGSSPAMRWTNPPVAWMMQAGISRLLDAGLVFPAHHHPSREESLAGPWRQGRRIALEAYPGYTARMVTRASYKSDAVANQNAARDRARAEIVAAILTGRAGLDVRLTMSQAWRRRLLDDGSGDLVDAVIAAMQAAHAALLPRYGLPDDLDPLEGWIAAVPPPGNTVPPPSNTVPPPSNTLPDPAVYHPAVAPLLAWFDREQRLLPWRKNRDPYRVWVSEIMLQQTQVARVKEFFTKFMARFPAVEVLAAAAEADVLAHWEGLGYYRRARQMHAAARKITAEHGGEFPRSAEGLRRLPGIGRYTAGAIASIAFAQPEPIVEANSRRVIARLAGHARRLDGPGGDEAIWKLAAAMVPKKHSGRFNQALMDLGATVCTPVRPACHACPLEHLCVARRTGRVDRIPAKSSRAKTIHRHEAAIVNVRRGRVLLVQRQEGEWWAGLWDFPRVAVKSRKAAEKFGEHVGTIRHSVTCHRITLEVIKVAAGAAAAGKSSSVAVQSRWVPVGSLHAVPLPSPARKIARLLAEG
jgi:A/G-specific adenine glycosylase